MIKYLPFIRFQCMALNKRSICQAFLLHRFQKNNIFFVLVIELQRCLMNYLNKLDNFVAIKMSRILKVSRNQIADILI